MKDTNTVKHIFGAMAAMAIYLPLLLWIPPVYAMASASFFALGIILAIEAYQIYQLHQKTIGSIMDVIKDNIGEIALDIMCGLFGLIVGAIIVTWAARTIERIIG